MKERIMIDDSIKKLISSKYRNLYHWLSETKNWTNISIKVLYAPEYMYPIIEVEYDLKPEDRIYREQFEFLLKSIGA